VTFDEILPAVKAGGKARRKLWADLDGRVGSWIELVTVDGFGGVLAGPLPGGGYVLFSGANWDILADDWEIL